MIAQLVTTSEITPTWLQNTLFGRVRIPHEDPSATLIEQLIAVYDRAESLGQSQFQSAVTSVLAATRVSPETYDAIYMLLQMVAYTKPVNAPGILQKLLRGRELLYLVPEGGSTLEIVAIQAQAEYEVSDWLVDFLLRRLQEGVAMQTLLTALELFSLREDTPLETPLVILCRGAQAEIPRHLVLESCFTCLRRAGMKRFFEVFCGESLSAIAGDAAEGGRVVLRAMTQAADTIGEKDPWFHPLRAILATLVGDPVRSSIETLAGSVLTAGDMLDQTIESINQAADVMGENILVTRIATSDYAQTLDDIPVEYLSIVDVTEAKVDLINRVKQGGSSKLGREVSFAHERTMRQSFAAMISNSGEVGVPA